MNIVIIRENLAIPIRNIDYVKLIEHGSAVELWTRTMGHKVHFDILDEAIEFFDEIVEAIENLKK